MAEKRTRGHPYHLWSENALAMALAIIGVLMGIVGIIWHGWMGQPSIMSQLYPNWTWSMSNSLMLLIGFAICGYIGGYVTAWLYNWSLKRK